jgi:hypothetical protein
LVVGVGVEVAHNFYRASNAEYRIDTLQTRYIDPSDLEVEHHIHRALRDYRVWRYLAKTSFRKPVFIITGVKVATGARSRTFESHGNGQSVNVGIDGTPWGAPVEFGPNVVHQTMSTDNVSWNDREPYVFAYRLHKILVSASTSEISMELYDKGALYGVENDNSVRAPEYNRIYILEDDAMAKDFKNNLEDAVDEDGAECYVVTCAASLSS